MESPDGGRELQWCKYPWILYLALGGGVNSDTKVSQRLPMVVLHMRTSVLSIGAPVGGDAANVVWVAIRDTCPVNLGPQHEFLVAVWQR